MATSSDTGARSVSLDDLAAQTEALTNAIRRSRLGDVMDATDEERQAYLDAFERLDAAYRSFRHRLNATGIAAHG
jgi:hypothetical protein